MGTRKSRHNKGRKRRTFRDLGDGVSVRQISLAESDAANISVALGPELLRTAYYDGLRLDTGCNWQPGALARLRALASQGYGIEKVADALGRSETSIVDRARKLRLEFPPGWLHACPWYGKKRERKSIADPRIILQFPYIVKKRDEHADLLAVNDLVPKGLPSYVRADICQEIMVAMFEGKLTLDDLRANKDKVRWFVGQFYKSNYEDGGRAISMTGMSDGEEFDRMESTLARNDWQWEQMNDRRKGWDAMSVTHYPATQIEDVFHFQVRNQQRKYHDTGALLDFTEAEDSFLAEGKLNRGSDALSTHKNQRLSERYGISPSKAVHEEMKLAVREDRVRVIRPADDRGIAEGWVRCQGRNVRIKFNAELGQVLTVLPPRPDGRTVRDALREEMGFVPRPPTERG